MTFRAREQGFHTFFQLKAKRFSKAVSLFPFCSESCLNLSVCFHCIFIEIMQEKVITVSTTFTFLCNEVEMSQDHTVSKPEECLDIIKSGIPIFFIRKAVEALGPLKTTHTVSNRADLKISCDT